MAYTTKAAVKLYLSIPDATVEDDDLIDAFISAAQAFVEQYTGRVFEAAGDTTQEFDAELDVSGGLLFFNEDLCAITSVTNGDGTEVTADQYITEPRRITPYFALRLLASSGVAWTHLTDPEEAISITGRWAFSTTAPADIVQATKRLAAWIYRQKDSNIDTDRPLITGDGATLLPSSLPNDILLLLKPYRRLI